MYETFEKLLQQHGVTAYKVSKETGVTQSTLSDWKRGRSTPKSSNMKKIADYFHVSVDYLMTGNESENKEWEPALTDKDEQDIQKELDNLLDRLDNNTGLMFDGEAMDDETKELLKASLEHAVRTARITAKKKYTPKKYRK
ncbi:helix-turn-helix domain-containing protein [Ihubacter massiliensis]|uniref:helix-turn-helix domain-containing protein n=1 Tax=Ihubacter massiliensis TaxID=1852367 RepID=UPI0011DDDC46|nr:helix-turn-helix transcriptional regulator [Ihubacter massiliensis]MCO7122061.1 helix-turn-helix domain-containing protein [Ihubacter massiliensis]